MRKLATAARDHLMGERDQLADARAGRPDLQEDLGVDPRVGFVRRLLATEPDRAHALLTAGDVLQLFQRSAERMREKAWLVDVDRVYQRAVANLALGPGTYFGPEDGNGEIDRAIERCIDHAIEQVVRSDEEEVSSGTTEHDPADSRFEFLIEGFAVRAAQTRAASVAFNALPSDARSAFFALLIELRTVDDCLASGFGPPERLRENCLRGLRALLDVGNSSHPGSNGAEEPGSAHES